MAKSKSLREYQRELKRNRATLDRVLDRRSVLSLKRYFDKAQDELERQLFVMARSVGAAPMTPLQAQQLLLQVHIAQQIVAQKLHEQFVPVSEEVQVEGVRETDRTIGVLNLALMGLAVTLPLTEPTVLRGLIEKRKGALAQSNEASFKHYGNVLINTSKEQVALSLAMGETPMEAIERVRRGLDDTWWQAERIIVTDTAKAFNTAHADSIIEAGKDLRDLKKRWTELVDDATGRPFDNRVGKDSMVLHGQVTSMDGVFVMPPDPTVHRSFWNQTYFQSPNRPNDRSVTMPWRPGYKIPGWEWRDGQRVDIPIG